MHLTSLLLAVLPLALAAPVLTPKSGQIIKGNYIIKMKDGASVDAVESAISKCKNKKPKHRYGFDGFKGFSAEIDDDALDAVANMEEVSTS